MADTGKNMEAVNGDQSKTKAQLKAERKAMHVNKLEIINSIEYINIDQCINNYASYYQSQTPEHIKHYKLIGLLFIKIIMFVLDLNVIDVLVTDVVSK